ncbi:hypothetical protein LZ518_03575 [Sphingomonas sp. RB56-2]|uniref:Uncharacterized protein n=1 Tax=Sphingomonas brevis TaxID=2908206 RepID=A0ABT0S737_9SPHN|nr:hypothetical protein [Sphingomonas brevis]MCL6740215.1 hypothetical protein [Sphingomonas brevis]
MLTKIGGLARSLYILVAVIAGFVPMAGMNVALILVVLGLISGITMPRERLVLTLVAVVALPLIGTAMAVIPAIGAQLGAVMANLQLGAAGAAAAAMAVLLYELTMQGVMGLAGGGSASGSKVTA